MPKRGKGRLLAALLAASLATTAPALAEMAPLRVSGPEISMLVRATIVALHQANLTANYSVLRDLGDSQFQAAYSQAALADMFRGFRERGINLEPAVLSDAELDVEPKLTQDGLLRVAGHFPTTPQQIVFDITFRSEGGIWRIDAINAGTTASPQASLPMPPRADQQAPVQTASAAPATPQDPTNLVQPFPAELGRLARVPGVVDLMN
jgi:hypothetical protein